MSASTGEGWSESWSRGCGEGCDEWDELPTDGSDAWLGMLLMVISGVGMVKLLIWLVSMTGKLFMP